MPIPVVACETAAARLLRLCVRIPPGAWMSVPCECCVLSGRGLCVGLDHSSRGVLQSAVCLNECDRGASIKKRPWTTRGCCTMWKERKKNWTFQAKVGEVVTVEEQPIWKSKKAAKCLSNFVVCCDSEKWISSSGFFISGQTAARTAGWNTVEAE
jgi:hypothetical protein